MKINEIFYSIQGESTYAGLPTVFVRTSACNLRCTYCDTTYAYYEGSHFSQEQILTEIERHQTRYVCITGGEPLLQNKVYALMRELCDRNFKVSLETSGSIFCGDVDARVRKIIDVKTPDSGAADSFEMRNLQLADVNSEFKFVICSEKDFEWSEAFAREHDLFTRAAAVLYSPSFSEIGENWLAKKILSAHSPARLQLQLHKYIWFSTERGV
jgi:7-carboxy-7-deazaguanine synthase